MSQVMTLKDDAVERLEGLRVKVGAKDLAQVVRHALALYELIVHQMRPGSELIIRHSDGFEQEIEGPVPNAEAGS